MDEKVRELTRQLEEESTRQFPDFGKMESLVNAGADVNAYNEDWDQALLATVISYHARDNEKGELNESLAEPDSLLKVIRFFLDHGFVVSRDEYRYGAQCMGCVNYCHYPPNMIPAVKMLLDAGARNVKAYPGENEETPAERFSTSATYAGVCEKDYESASLSEAVYRVLVQAEEGHPYYGVDYHYAAIGKKLIAVYVDKPEGGMPIYQLDTPLRDYSNCFRGGMRLKLEDGWLNIEDAGYLWYDSVVPVREIVEVTNLFWPIIGAGLTTIKFACDPISKDNTTYVQPMSRMHFDNGMKLHVQLNNGLVPSESVCSYFRFEGAI